MATVSRRPRRTVYCKDALLVSDGRAAYGQFADANGLLHIKLVTSKREYTYGSYHIQNVNAYISRLKPGCAASTASPPATWITTSDGGA